MHTSVLNRANEYAASPYLTLRWSECRLHTAYQPYKAVNIDGWCTGQSCVRLSADTVSAAATGFELYLNVRLQLLLHSFKACCAKCRPRLLLPHMAGQTTFEDLASQPLSN